MAYYAESRMSKEELEKEIWQYLSRHDTAGLESYDFDIKIQKIDVPDAVREMIRLPETEIGARVDVHMAQSLEAFVAAVMGRYAWIHGWHQSGRSGGWLVLWTDEPVTDQFGKIPWDPGRLSKRQLSKALAPARKRLKDLREIEGFVERAKQDLVRELEDPKWWGVTPKDWRPKKK